MMLCGQFVQKLELSGLCTGMFISELGEADYLGFAYIDQAQIDQLNESNSSIISKYLNEQMEVSFQKLLSEYELLSESNSITGFNLERLFIFIKTINQSKRKR